MYKKLSKLSKGNIVKTIHRIRKDIPPKLKHILQKKAIGNKINEATDIVKEYLKKWEISDTNINNGLFQEVTVSGAYNEETGKLRINVTLNPVGTIESIEVPIIVV